MSDLAKEIAEITERYKREIDALKEAYLKKLEGLKGTNETDILNKPVAQVDLKKPVAQVGLKKKIEATSPSYFG